MGHFGQDRLRFQAGGESQAALADRKNVARNQADIILYGLISNQCPISTVQVAEFPHTIGIKNLAVVAATGIVMQDQLVRCRTPHSRHLALAQSNYVAPAASIPAKEESFVSAFVHNRQCFVLLQLECVNLNRFDSWPKAVE